jgi:peptidyl-prolyl cis-trans isomerase B (cyclophilin B)
MKFLVVSVVGTLAAQGFAQIVPQYDYNGVSRSFPVALLGRARVAELKLMTAEGKVLQTAKATGKKMDLAVALPYLWQNKDPHLLYCQGFSKGVPVGPALVLQPMISPPISRLKADGKTVEFVPEESQAYAGIRAWVDRDIVFHTSMGDMRFKMRPDCAPNTVWEIMHLVTGGFYRNVIWHRVVAMSHGFPFVIQGGDPAGTGDGGPGFSYPLEDSSLPHDLGVISIARDTDPNTNGCQVFVCLSREGTARLDHKYASFGQILEGLDAVKKIAALPVGKDDRPLQPPTITTAELVDSAPRKAVP